MLILLLPVSDVFCYYFEVPKYLINAFGIDPLQIPFGITVPNNDRVVHTVCTLYSWQQVHGHDITQENVVVDIIQILRPGLCPLCL